MYLLDLPKGVFVCRLSFWSLSVLLSPQVCKDSNDRTLLKFGASLVYRCKFKHYS